MTHEELSMPATAMSQARNHLLRSMLAIGVALLLMALFGCASLPAPTLNPISTAMPPDTATELGRVAAVSMADSAAGESGFRLLADGDPALHARLTPLRHPDRSIAAQ